MCVNYVMLEQNCQLLTILTVTRQAAVLRPHYTRACEYTRTQW